MKVIGKLDLKIYACISDHIVTDEVILTDNQQRHIFSEHPDAREEIDRYLETAVRDPDYILSDKHENTGMVVKRMDVAEGNIMLILRVCVTGDTPGYKNSIISGWIISEKRLQNYMRHRKILYKKEETE